MIVKRLKATIHLKGYRDGAANFGSRPRTSNFGICSNLLPNGKIPMLHHAQLPHGSSQRGSDGYLIAQARGILMLI